MGQSIKILVTGSKGFIGKNLIEELRNRHYKNIFEYDVETPSFLFEEYCQEADFVFHLAGVNRPKERTKFMEGNFGFTSRLIETLKKKKNNCPVMISSSIQADLDNPYGKSKKEAENLLFKYSIETGAKVFIYRFPNVFGKWSKPNYNSAVATFCYNIANGLPINVVNRSVVVKLVYIDDVIEELINTLEGKVEPKNFCEVKVMYEVPLGAIVDLINSFKRSRNECSIPDMSDEFTKKLYSTYLSYLPIDEFGVDLKMHKDYRGSFTEFLKTPDRGQVSVNISKPGITKGNHWHHSKSEKFLVISGKGVFHFRCVGSDKVFEYFVSGDKLQVIDVPVGYVHNITNIGNTDLITLMWANELYNPNKSDTKNLKV